VVTEDLANIDFMPTFLDVAGAECPKDIAGQSFLPLLEGKKIPWRKDLLYSYYWERNFPQTPTMHAIRTDRFKYVHYYGIWDTDELYDLQEDPHELRNLINSVDHQKIIAGLKQQLFSELEGKGGMYIPLFPDSGPQMNHRNPDGAHAADFPADMYAKPKVSGVH
jgi:N-acetylglucosamine-6-sulfatase